MILASYFRHSTEKLLTLPNFKDRLFSREKLSVLSRPIITYSETYIWLLVFYPEQDNNKKKIIVN